MKDSRYLSVLHVSCCSCEAPTSDDHNFLVRSSFCAFLDSMGSSLSLESNHMHVDGICAQIFSEKLIIALSALISRILNERDCYVSLLNN